MPETNNTQAITTSTATTDAPSTTPAPVDELADARARITVLEEQLAATERDRADLVQRLDDVHQRDAERPELRMLSLLERFVAATEASALLSLAAAQPHTAPYNIAQGLRRRAAELLRQPTR